MSEVAMVGIDLANRFHAARADGSIVFRKKLSRSHVLAFFAGFRKHRTDCRRQTFPFYMVLGIYGPRPEALSGAWLPPKIMRR